MLSQWLVRKELIDKKYDGTLRICFGADSELSTKIAGPYVEITRCRGTGMCETTHAIGDTIVKALYNLAKEVMKEG
jgi:hypothetical protein